MPPAIQLLLPTNAAAYSTADSIPLLAVALNTNQEIARVDFFYESASVLGLVPLGSVTNAPFALNGPLLAAGGWRVFAQAVDRLGSVSFAASEITVTNAPPPNDDFENRTRVMGAVLDVSGYGNESELACLHQWSDPRVGRAESCRSDSFP